MIESSSEAHIFHKKGGVFAHQSEKITEEDKVLILSVASVVFEYKLPPEFFVSGREKTNSFSQNTEGPKYEPYKPEEAVESESESESSENLKFFNGFGGFSSDGKEYHIRIKRNSKNRLIELPPAPWVNVVSNETFGFIATEKGSGYTWSVNSRENKLTTWSNDPVTDPHSEAIYIRDEDSKKFWSPTPGPVPGEGDYRVIHGHGYTQYHSVSAGLKQELTQFVPIDESVKISVLTLWNESSDQRKLSVFSYLEWVLGVERIQSARHLIPVYQKTGIVCMRSITTITNLQAELHLVSYQQIRRILKSITPRTGNILLAGTGHRKILLLCGILTISIINLFSGMISVQRTRLILLLRQVKKRK